MGDTAKDPVDHARTTRPHAGETLKDTTNIPALVLLFLGGVSFVSCLFAFSTSHETVGILLAVAAAVLFVISGAWLVLEHRRVTRKEREWNAAHPEVHQNRP
ncbi:protein UsfY [Mycolicibacterium goodii]|jgi:prepilin signal peptidase PulO-like enzyme (type II secretory pathway)|uniref:LapA family protein n=1 Tax=Mycolicibacterium goodii TaxID=134601 RepID=A0ABS6HKA4_MYCGD|nr:protein UsfY [Mycolicibacterium goodii]OKH72205.1 UsfY protein [Mycobacterium sp. SWH-M5]MBU8810024.1 LapA family protein [Mycolicibacterium goodii]MBU8818876.1 LapA family protein [Mycolicibacterium goodii]MBU8822020.1 LapA family protein [Mycolicibacterium goodii]MBU8828515.1 LapA family protein [Mycolicibacterium goodii]